MTYTLIATITLDAYIHICTPPPPLAHTQFGIGIQTLQHTTYNVEGAEGREEGTHKHLTITPGVLGYPPPFDVLVWVLGLLLLVALHLRLGRVSFLFSQVVCKNAKIAGEFAPRLVVPLFPVSFPCPAPCFAFRE